MIRQANKLDSYCICVNDVKQTFIKKCSTIEFIIGAIAPVLTKIYKINFIHFCKFNFYATANSSSALFSFGVKYPNTAIGILFDLFKYALPCFIKSSRL